MKNIYIIGGTMGVGKTTVSQILKKSLTAVSFSTVTGVGTPILSL